MQTTAMDTSTMAAKQAKPIQSGNKSVAAEVVANPMMCVEKLSASKSVVERDNSAVEVWSEIAGESSKVEKVDE